MWYTHDVLLAEFFFKGPLICYRLVKACVSFCKYCTVATFTNTTRIRPTKEPIDMSITNAFNFSETYNSHKRLPLDIRCHISKTKMQKQLQEALKKKQKKLLRTFPMSFFYSAYNVNFE